MKYFIYRKGRKSKPLSLEDIRSQRLRTTDLVWRDDQVEWMKATEFDELKDVIEPTAPETPLESRLKYTMARSAILLKTLSAIYVPLALILGFVSANFEYREYEEYINGVEPYSDLTPASNRLYASNLRSPVSLVRNSLLSELDFSNVDDDSHSTPTPTNLLPENYDPQISRTLESFSIDQAYILKNGKYYCRYSTFLPSRNNETYHYEQSHKLFLRPFRTFAKEVYLSEKEQGSKIVLIQNMIWASFINLLWIFISILAIYAFVVFMTYPIERHTSTTSHP